jgi:O-antigen/teichoic acid export membrane protein
MANDNPKGNGNLGADLCAEPGSSAQKGRVRKNYSGSNKTNDQHFATDHLLDNLKGRTISSGFVTILAQGIQFVFNLVSIMVLARLLTPQDFGLVAMATTINGFLRIFNDAGLSTATVQREGITHAQVSNLFWTNVALGGTVTLILAGSAPAVAWFYREPRVVSITLVLSVTFLLTSSTVQHLAILKRQMRFKAIAFIQVSSITAGALVGISMAWLKYGYWSLVGMQLTIPIVTFCLTLMVSRWRPQLPTRHSGTRSLLTFGANLSASTFLWSLARSSDGLLIGRFLGPTSLGLYSRAAALLLRPVEQLISPIEAVFVPTLSRLQPHPERYRRTLLRIYDIIAITSFPVSGLFLALAHPLTLVVLGSKWEKAAPVFAGFTLIALYTPVASVASWLLTSQGRGRDFLILSLMGSFGTIVAFLVGLPFGPAGVAASYSAYCLLIGLPIIYYVVGRRGPVTTRDLWSRFLTHLPLWGVVCSGTFVFQLLLVIKLTSTPLVQLLISGFAGLLIGASFICVYSPARRTALELFVLLKDWSKARKAART